MFGSRNHPYTHPTASKVFEDSDGVREGGGGAKVKNFKGKFEAIEFKFLKGGGGTKKPPTGKEGVGRFGGGGGGGGGEQKSKILKEHMKPLNLNL